MHSSVNILSELRISGFNEVQEVCVTHLFDSLVLINWKLFHYCQFYFFVRMMHVERFLKSLMKIR